MKIPLKNDSRRWPALTKYYNLNKDHKIYWYLKEQSIWKTNTEAHLVFMGNMTNRRDALLSPAAEERLHQLMLQTKENYTIHTGFEGLRTQTQVELLQTDLPWAQAAWSFTDKVDDWAQALDRNTDSTAGSRKSGFWLIFWLAIEGLGISVFSLC